MSGDELAYPWGEHGVRFGGLTKRELFAAMAMQGMVGRTDLLNHERAAYAVDAADCLLAELIEEPK